MKQFNNMPNDQYHSHKDYISSSFVKSVAKHSIAKALQPIQPSQALLFGDAMHTFFEDKGAYTKRFRVFDDTAIIADILERRPDISAPTMTKDYKVFKQEFEESLKEGEQVISMQDHDTIVKMYDSATNNQGLKKVMELYEPAEVLDEHSFFTEEEDLYGLKYRVRPDRLLQRNSERLAVIDWKSCRDASERAFKSDFWKYRYDLQAAFYCQVLGIPMDDFYFVAIEKEYPYNTAVYGIDSETQVRATEELGKVLYRIGEWKENPTPQNESISNANTITLLWVPNKKH